MKRKNVWNAEPQHTQELTRAARLEHNGRVRSRMLAVRHLLTGHEIEETAGLFLIGRSQLYHWLHRYRIEGLAGLRDRPRPGAPKHLKAEDENAFRQMLEGSSQKNARHTELRGEDIRNLLRDKFNANYSLSGVYGLLRRLGLSNLIPRAS
jgi:putative transposase